MTNRRSFFGCLAGLFAGFTAVGRTGKARTSNAKPGKVTLEFSARMNDGLLPAVVATERTTRVRVENGVWDECPELGDKSEDGFYVVNVSKGTYGSVYVQKYDELAETQYVVVEWKFTDPYFDPNPKALR